MSGLRGQPRGNLVRKVWLRNEFGLVREGVEIMDWPSVGDGAPTFWSLLWGKR
jgi:hypothetical protein